MIPPFLPLVDHSHCWWYSGGWLQMVLQWSWAEGYGQQHPSHRGDLQVLWVLLVLVLGLLVWWRKNILREIIMIPIVRMYDQADISCLVENEEGENVASTNLDVNYAPTILLHPRWCFLVIVMKSRNHPVLFQLCTNNSATSEVKKNLWRYSTK